MATGQLRIEYLDIEALVGQAENPKGHDLEALAESFGRFGYREPMVMDESSGKLVGHGRLERLRLDKAQGSTPPEYVQERSGHWFAPVVRGGTFASPEEATAYVIAANRLSERGGWREEALRPLLARLKEQGLGLAGTGFAEKDLKAMLALCRTEPERDIPVEDLRANIWNPNTMSAREQEQLQRSLESVGQVQPLLVRPLDDGSFEIVDGEWRWRMAQKLGWPTVRCLVRKLSDDEARLAWLAAKRNQGALMSALSVPFVHDLRRRVGDAALMKAAAMDKTRLNEFSGLEDSDLPLDPGEAETRTLRDYGPGDFAEIGDMATMILAFSLEDYNLVGRALNTINAGNWSAAFLEIVRQWMELTASPFTAA
jgi:hypothetical protein